MNIFFNFIDTGFQHLFISFSSYSTRRQSNIYVTLPELFLPFTLHFFICPIHGVFLTLQFRTVYCLNYMTYKIQDITVLKEAFHTQ